MLEMARLVAPGRMVTGVDMDEVKLGLATQAGGAWPQQRGIPGARCQSLG